MESIKRPFSPQPGRWFRLAVVFHAVALATAMVSSVPIDPETEATLLSRIEAKHERFPTYVYGASRAGNPVIYKTSLSGLRDFHKFFVLQTDSYIIDLWLQATGAASFTLVLDFSALSNRMRLPTLDMWESLRTVVDPLPAVSRASIERMVSQVFARCEAVVVVNATSFLKLLKPVISLMVPVSNEKLFVSTDASAILRVVQPSNVPRPYNPTATESAGSNPQTDKLYGILNERARELLGRPLAVSLPAALPPPVGEKATVKQPSMGHTPKPASTTDSTHISVAEGREAVDDFDDID